VVPTTFAGADLSSGGSVTVLEAEESPTAQPIRTGGSVRPIAMIYDPDLFETTPMSALAGSSMNGFDKGLETIYSSHATPITDATAMRGLQLLRESLPNLDGNNPTEMERAVIGIILVQFERRGSIIHTIGHGFSRRYPVQQGIVHAIVAPHALRYLFQNVDGRRRQLAQAFDVGEEAPDDEVSTAIVNGSSLFVMVLRSQHACVMSMGSTSVNSRRLRSSPLGRPYLGFPLASNPLSRDIESILRGLVTSTADCN